MFKLILIILLLIFLYFYRVSLNYKNPYKLVLLMGVKGAGKNTYLTKMSIKYNRMGYTVFSDSEIFNTYKLDNNWIGKYDFPKNSVLLVQEAGITWDNRNFKSFPHEVRDFFKLQRHKNVIVFLASQSFDVDKKLRDLTDEMYLIVPFMRIFSIAKRICKRPDIVKKSSGDQSNGNQSQDGFISDVYSWSLPIYWHFTYIPRYVKYFNSFECDKLPPVKSEKYVFNDQAELYKETRLKYWFSKKFADFINDQFDHLQERHKLKLTYVVYPSCYRIKYYEPYWTTL